MDFISPTVKEKSFYHPYSPLDPGDKFDDIESEYKVYISGGQKIKESNVSIFNLIDGVRGGIDINGKNLRVFYSKTTDGDDNVSECKRLYMYNQYLNIIKEIYPSFDIEKDFISSRCFYYYTSDEKDFATYLYKFTVNDDDTKCLFHVAYETDGDGGDNKCFIIKP